MKESWTYITDKSGNVRRIPAKQVIKHDPNDTRYTFEERIMRNMYGMECSGHDLGRSGYTPSTLKRVWESANERAKAGIS